MDAPQQEEGDQTSRSRATVLVMPRRPQPDGRERKVPPPPPDHGESPDEPGYGHGV
jgi:hypothetical protein